MSSTYTSMFPTTEGDLWHWQLETMNELTAFVRAHGPGLPGALPVVPWQISAGFHATARLGAYDGPADGPRRDRVAVLEAYAAALGTHVTSVDAGGGYTQYRVQGTIGRRVQLLLIADVREDDDQDGGA